MTQEKVMELLKDYRACVGRCGHLREMAAELEARIEWMKRTIVEDLASVSSPNYDGMPHSTTVGNPTERVALILAEGESPSYIREAERELQEIRNELREKNGILRFVESWLAGLNDVERWVITHQLIDGMFWRDVVEAYNRDHVPMSRETLKRVKDVAFDKICNMAR